MLDFTFNFTTFGGSKLCPKSRKSRKRLFKTGRTPGIPRQIGQVFSFGGLPNSVEQEQNIFVLVLIWTWTSSPMTVSYFISESVSSNLFCCRVEVCWSFQVVLILITAGVPVKHCPQWAVKPPSTGRTVPVIKDDSSLAKKRQALATSSGFPNRPIG